MKGKSDTRNKILLTASRLFLRQGYHATGLNQIIKESGAPKGSLYYYFPNGKEELAIEAVKLTSDFIQQKITEYLDAIDDPVESMQAFIDQIAQGIIDLKEVIPYTVSLLALETSLISEPIRESCKNAFESWENGFSAKLVKSGFDKKKADELGIIIQVMMEGALISALTKKDMTPLYHVAKYIPLLLKQ
ncbi:MAG: TetR family transcriptional regulator [Bacillota bacterium]|jgi:TetR/AcrR family transcriptional repressor of lmrAB and yxaGH operons|nr:TetR family transcriptional regulator [Bacillota bacterium]